MLDVNTYRQHWQHPLHVQWQDLIAQNEHENVNYSAGQAVGFLQLRGKLDNQDFVTAIEKVLGVALPAKSKGSVYAEQAAILWLSPDEWLLVCAIEHKAVLFQALQDALKGIFAQVVDNTGGMMLMRVHGQEASTVLRHLSPYNVLSLQEGQCAHTVLKRSSTIMLKVAENDYAIIFRRSFADYIWRILQKTAKPYGHAIQKSWRFADDNWQRYTA